MPDLTKIRALTESKLGKAMHRLKYSYAKVKKLGMGPAVLDDDESLETWEGFSSRFARLTDIFLSRYLRIRVLEGDPGFRGTFRDLLDQAEKAALVSSADRWFAIRDLRNKAAHDYEDGDLERFFQTLLTETDFVLGEIQPYAK